MKQQVNIQLLLFILIAAFIIGAILLAVDKNIPSDSNSNPQATSTKPTATTTIRQRPKPEIVGAFHQLPMGECEVAKEFREYQYDDNQFSAKPFLEFFMKLPPDIWPQGAEGGGGIRSFPIFSGNYPDVIHHFYIHVGYIDHPDFDTTLDWIRNATSFLKKDYRFPIDFAEDMINVTKIQDVTQLYQKFSRSQKGCIDNFIRELDNLYIVEPINEGSYNLFEDNGIVHNNRFESDDLFHAPWGIYATKYVNNIPLTVHFLWAKDGGPFFRNKAYTIEGILWSIRFDLLEEMKKK